MKSKWLREAKGLYLFVGIAIAGLIGVQLYWISANIHLQKVAAERSLKSDINSIIKTVVDDAYCVYFNSKAYVKSDEGIYIIKQQCDTEKFIAPPIGHLDTLDMYNAFFLGNDTSFYKTGSLSFGMPATVDILIKVKFALQSGHVKTIDTNSYMIRGVNEKNYKEMLSDRQSIDEIINPDLLDSMIGHALFKNNFDTVYQLGIKRSGAGKFEYLRKNSQPSRLLAGSLKFTFLGDNFSRPYELYLYLPDPMGHTIRSMMWVMISSIAVILVLIFSYAWFIRTILNQKKLSEMKNMFINNITHEFNTPITNINLAIENWRNAKAHNSEYYMGIIREENIHMEKNVEQILQLATIEHNHVRIYPDKLDINELIQETVNSFEIQLELVRGMVTYNFTADKYIYGDRQLLKNLLYNLVDNAIKYRKEDLQIGISTRDTNGNVAISIQDNGIGMSADTQKYIFDRFYRGDKSDRHDVKGFGLGLSYVKYIVQAHNGSIEVDSRKGQGTTFTIYLPRHIKTAL
jgi:two-component system phosphate regulon sensor histidine kinase PhoR